ncbi:MAG: lysophospholipid acyltransferase family protein [Lentisphaerae bacterium]|nr:lysophospholipid acyltransferase family protein [Lentisphaerota bacterium]
MKGCMRRWRRTVRRPAEWLLLGLGCAVIPWLPRRGVTALARWSGGAAFRLAPRLRRVALANLDVAFGARLGADEKVRLARASFVTFARTLLDVFWFAFRTASRLERYVGIDPSFEPYFEGGAIIVVTGHIGNWEVMGQAAALRGKPSLSVAAPVKNRAADWLLTRARRSTGQRIVPRRGALRALLRALQEGQGVALLIDQNVEPRKGGVFVDFFGLPAPVTKAPAALARRTGAPLLFAWCLPSGPGYRIFALPLEPPPASGTADRTHVQKLAAMLETVVRKHPGDWLWMYKRWKHGGPGADRTRYPFYAE